MDAGCYAINWLRMLGPGEPEVVAARAKLHGPAWTGPCPPRSGSPAGCWAG